MKQAIISFLSTIGLIVFTLIGFLILQLLVKNEFQQGFYVGVASTLIIVLVIYESKKYKNN